MTNTITIFRDRADRFGALLAGAEGRWDAPTPCTDWTVADVVSHVIDSERDFLQRHDLPMPERDADADPAAAWDAHATAALTALEADGVADRAFDGYFGPTTIGDTMANFYGWDLAVHAWDVARGTGQPDPISDAEAVALSAAADGWGPTLYSEGICADPLPVDPDAGDAEKLLARLGRDPQWTPSA